MKSCNWGYSILLYLTGVILAILCVIVIILKVSVWGFCVAAMVIQNSIQVYSRKVEYLYSLVLNALEFITQQRYVFKLPRFVLYSGLIKF